MSWSSTIRCFAIADDILRAISIKRLMLQFPEVLLIYKIEFWCELTIAILIWENVDLCSGQKYTLTYRLGERRSRFRRRIDV